MKIKIPYWHFLVLPAALFGLGFMLNALALASNHGYMPVQGAVECAQGQAEQNGDVIHVCLDKHSRALILTDWIYWPGQGTMSLGDLAEMGGQYSFYPCLFIWFAFICKDYSEDSEDY